ncbi:MAG: hypothetical protein IM551_03680 [Chitinophagaceae bacterium]|nr:hypothetical protein [Chitinophagaceae bacterium]
MKLKTFNAETFTNVSRSTKPFISANAKSGLLSLNRAAVKELSVKAGDQVHFHQDEDSPENWYIEKVKSGGFELRTYGKRDALAFNSSMLARTIFESVDCYEKYGRLIIGEPVKEGKQTFFTLITASLKNK